jgi:flagellar basal body-associated protein FliL
MKKLNKTLLLIILGVIFSFAFSVTVPYLVSHHTAWAEDKSKQQKKASK